MHTNSSKVGEKSSNQTSVRNCFDSASRNVLFILVSGFIKQLLHYSEKGLGNTEEPLFFAEYLIGMFTLDKEVGGICFVKSMGLTQDINRE